MRRPFLLDTLYFYSLIPVLSIALLLCFSMALRGGRQEEGSLVGLTLLFGSIALWCAALMACFLEDWVWLGQRFAACGTLIVASFHHTVWDLTGQPRRWVTTLAYVLALGILGFGVFSPGMLYDPTTLTAGPFFWQGMALAVGATALPLGHLFLAARGSKGATRHTFVMLGVAGGSCMIGAWINALLLSSGRKLPFGIFLVLLSMLLFARIVSQSQSRLERQLIDRSLLYSGLGALISAGFLFGTLNLLEDTGLRRSYGLGAFFLLAMAAVAIEPLRQHMLERVGRKLPGRQSATDIATALIQTKERHAHQARLVELGTFISAIAHEVRNPLGVLRANLRLMEMEGADPDLVDAMSAQIQRAETFVHDLLDYGRPKPLELRLLDAAELVAIATSSALQGRGTLGAKVSWEQEVGADVMFEADHAQILQVLIILLDNAILAVSDCPHPKVRLTIFGTKEDVTLQVEDNGPGIPQAVVPKLFEPFVTSRGRDSGGTGLGLAIAAKLTVRHFGTLSADRSPELGGARFRLTLPKIHPLLEPAP